MIDTIILELPDGCYIIADHSKFSPSTTKMRQTYDGFRSYKNNPTAEDKAKGLYLPRLTIYQRGIRFPLKVEFSAPKLLYNNNVNELQEADFDRTVDALQKKMAHMGVRVFKNLLVKAPVTAFHPSKNILLSNGYTPSFVIRELSKCDISKRFDFEVKSYRNNGLALQIYTNTHSIVFYDKVADLNRPAKRAIDKDKTPQQLTLFDYLTSFPLFFS